MFINVPAGAETCSKCGKGEYSDVTGAGSCNKCPVKTYGDVEGMIYNVRLHRIVIFISVWGIITPIKANSHFLFSTKC